MKLQNKKFNILNEIEPTDAYYQYDEDAELHVLSGAPNIDDETADDVSYELFEIYKKNNKLPQDAEDWEDLWNSDSEYRPELYKLNLSSYAGIKLLNLYPNIEDMINDLIYATTDDKWLFFTDLAYNKVAEKLVNNQKEVVMNNHFIE